MDYLKTVNRSQLKQMFDEQRDFVLIDVLPAEFYDAVHLHGAVNACVYEVDFVTQVENLVGDKNRTIVIYCNSATSKASEVAVQKLAHAGFTSVLTYKGGTLDWRRAGNPVDGTHLKDVAVPHVEERTYEIDPAQSVIEWIGRNITGSHYGTVNILSGTIPIRRGLPSSAAFVVDMDSIANLDVLDPTLNQVLVAHLKSEDFFEVERFPTGHFDSTSFVPIDGAKSGAPNYNVHGRLTLKGITHEVTFPAVIALRDDDHAIVAEAHFDIDRTQWNINYGSGKLFEKLGRHLVYDNITLQMKLVAR